MLLASASQLALARSFEIKQVDASFNGQHLSVDSQFSLSLNDVVIDAIHNGIPVTLSTTIELFRPRKFWLDKQLANWQFDYTLRYHSLTSTYLLDSPFLSAAKSYSKLEDALQEIAKFHFDSEIIEQTLPASTEGYYLQLQISLNIDALPAPLRVVAFASPPWRLKSEPYEWAAE